MLDSETKRRIDSCRDILVGKVPDPKSQVEQITIALIYKFMDDMDAEAEEMGGSRSFFAGEYGKYGWARLMAPNMGGFDMLALYSEAIQKMNENPGIPPLFRDIFKNAYLPYRDPETLRIFLKEIDGFTYEHSERLGDAFEYLLSILGSQGEAGQFRTPRHVIDFMVEIIDPKKNETILDPACGTAGFLISSYKHILKHNSKDYRARDDQEAYDEKGVPLEAVTLDSPLHYKGDLLTPDERKRLAGNIKGYDISPDMVRLSLVNMYLHGFTNPYILEYDTLTSEERWNDYADIILANPPFMSPKGGIKPHKRFSIQATRSEVLFVDYIAEHLTPTGRAAVIVPEGIIFQSGGAYKQLRKMLVENYLVAVVSLPAGVFNPYSGVKTSILIMDRRLARKTDSVLFAKIENDGFNLGAQRRPIGGSHLPAAARNIKAWMDSVRGDSLFDLEGIPNLHLVEKVRIGDSGDWNLSGERYRENEKTLSVWPLVPVRDVFLKSEESVLPESLKGPVVYIGLENITQDTGDLTGNVLANDPTQIKSLKNIFNSGDILYGKLRPNLNKVWLANINGICSTDIFVIQPRGNRVIPELYAYIFRSSRFNESVLKQLKGAQLPRVGWTSFAEIKIPLPPLDVQKELVAEIEGYQKIIDGARQVVENYQPRIPVDPDWPIVSVGELFRRSEKSVFPESLDGPVMYIGLENITQHTGEITGNVITDRPAGIRSLKNVFQHGDILYGKLRPNLNKVWLADHNGICSTDIFVIQPLNDQVIPAFYANIFRDNRFNESVMAQIKGAQLPRVGWSSFADISVPLPPPETQRAIVAQIEKEQRLVNANKELIRLFEAKVKTTINRVWGEAG